MKTPAILILTLSFALGSLHAQTVPLIINYQGQVTGGTGIPLGATGTAPNFIAAPENRKIIFRIFDAQTGGTRLWSEQQTATISLGEFSVLLGQGIDAVYDAVTESRPALDTVFTGGGAVPPAGPVRYLEIVVDDGNGTFTSGADVPVAPRQRITTSAYSFRSRIADTVPNLAIATPALADGAVTAAKVADNSITSLKISDGSVSTAKIAENSITTAKIAAGSIDSSKLATGAVTTASIAAGAIDSTKLAAGAVTTAAIAANAIDSTKLATGAATTAAIAANAIDSTKLATGAVTTAAIANNAINTSKIADGSVFEADLSNGSVTAAKLGPGIGVWGDPGTGNVYRASGQVTIGDTGAYGYQLNVIGSSYTTNISWATHFYNISDTRMKNIVARSNPHSDLELIRKLQVTDYRMIDEKMHGDGVQRGFIAQEVQKLIPEAVESMKRHPLPSIYAPATKATFDPDTKTLRIVLKKEHGLKKGDTVQLKDDKKSWEVNVAETIDATTFVAGPVEAPISDLFVYGKVVDDMLSVDYNRLYTTGIGAIQDLAKQVEAIKAENADLRTKLAASERRFAELEAADKSRDERLATIEKLLITAGKGTARTASVKAGK